MSIESIVNAALCASAVLSSYVAEPGSPTEEWRIYPDAAPQDAAHPFVVFTVDSEDPVASLSGSSGLTRALVTVDCYHASKDSADLMADEVKAVLFINGATFRGIGQTRAGDYVQEEKAYVVSQDFAIWA